MNKVIERWFDVLEAEFNYLYMHQDFKMNPEKQVNYIDGSWEYMNVLSGTLSDGTVGTKVIYVHELENVIDGKVLVKFPGEMLKEYTAKNLTIFRCGLVAAYVVWNSGLVNPLVTFVGAGKINLMTAYILELCGYNRFALVGGRRDPDKGLSVFRSLCGVSFDGDVRNSDIVITCTNNNDESSMFRLSDAPHTKLAITQDGGYTLHKEWFDGIMFSDYPRQHQKSLREEFPYNTSEERMNFDLLPLSSFDSYVDSARRVVNLYGTATADLVAARLFSLDYLKAMMIRYRRFAEKL